MLTASATKASATDVQCIEASKYKYLYQLFDDDRRRFADYFGLDADVRALPDPEFCRAALLSGPTGESGKDEFGDLVRMIARNRGWLAAIYLSSPGGSGSPFEMAFLLRKMRIKTVFAVDSDRRLVYSPDFAPTPPALVVPPTSSAVCYLKDQIASRSRTINTISGIVRPNPFEPTYEVNTDRPGADIRSVDLPRADGRLCQQRCQNEPRCRAWTFNGPPRINRPVCWLKFDVPAARDSEEGTISGVVRPKPFKPTFEPGFDFRGNDYNRINLSIADPRLCQQQCQADGRCRAWAYNGPGVPVPLTGWERYRKTQAALSPINVRFAECASSCSFIHSGGVDRSGPVNVHRPSAAHELSDFEDRQAAGARVRRFFEHMDAGEDLIQIWATTSASSLRPARATRFPRYLDDYLRSRCWYDADDLQRRETAFVSTGDKNGLAKLYEQRTAAEQCIAGEFERARLSVFDRLCGTRCDPNKLRVDIEAEITAAVGYRAD